MQQNIFSAVYILLLSAVIATLMAGCVFWIRWLAGFSRQNMCGDESDQVITANPQEKPKWTVVEFLLMFGLLLVTAGGLQSSGFTIQETPKNGGSERQVAAKADQASIPENDSQPTENNDGELDAASESVEAQASTSDPKKLIVAHTIANVVALSLTMVFLYLVYGATPQSLTLIPSKRDLWIGLIATAWILAPVLGINAIVSRIVEYEHAVTDMMAERSDPLTFAFLFFSAAILTPIAEEFQFRLLLQGGLQQLADPPADGDWNPRAIWPIVVTSLIFAAMHLGQGAAPIPLFFLSLGLGFLYQRTGRLVPVILVHMLLNSSTLMLEFCRINSSLVASY